MSDMIRRIDARLNSSRTGRLARRAAGASAHTLKRAATALSAQAEQRGITLDALVHQLTSPERAQQLQAVMARAASLGLDLGFRADPRAALLFGLIDACEQRHGRPWTLTCLMQHNAALDGSLLTLIQAHYAPASDLASYDAALARTSATMLRMLVALVEGPEGDALDASPDALVTRFELACPDPRFDALGAMARGDADALTSASKQRDEVAAQVAAADLLGKLRQRVSEAAAPLARRSTQAHEDHFQFLVGSYLLCVQGIMARAMIEQLPELFQRVDDLAASAAAAAPGGEVIVIGADAHS